MSTPAYYFTTAPRAYDYGCTDELRTDVLDKHGAAWRLVAIYDDRGGVFHRGQLPRYASGLHPAHEVSADPSVTHSAELTYLNLPSLHELGIVPSELAARDAYADEYAGKRLQRMCDALLDEGVHPDIIDRCADLALEQ